MRTHLEARKDRRAFVRRGVAVICLVLGGAAAASAQPVATELVNPGSATDDQFGSAFALSSDGGTLLVGAPTGTAAGGITGAGRIDVYTRQLGDWTQTAELSLPAALGPQTGDYFGSAVALSADGTLALVGAPGRSGGLGLGAFETFELQGGAWTWTSEVASSAVHQANLGTAVALSGDGLTAVASAPAESNGIGHCGLIHIYARSSGSWNESATLSLGSACAVSPFDTNLGRSLALSRDGGTIAATVEIMCVDGVPPCGAAYVFARNGGSWTTQARLAASNPLYFGQSASLSGDGSTAAVGGGIGGYIFERNGSVWTQTQGVEAGSMSLSADGLSLLVGAVGPNGGADLFTRTATGWIRALRIPDPEAPQNDGFGAGLNLSADGSTAAVWASRALRPGIGYFGKAYAVSLPASVVDTPTLGGAGLAALAVLLAVGGVFVLRRP